MKVYRKKTPRNFLVSKKNNIYLKDVGKVNLGINENLTFTSSGSKQYEVCRKDWGYYATPSINSRLKKNGFKTALAKQKKKTDGGLLCRFSSTLYPIGIPTW